MEFIIVGYLVNDKGTPVLTVGEFDGRVANARVTGAIEGDEAKQLFTQLKSIAKKN